MTFVTRWVGRHFCERVDQEDGALSASRVARRVAGLGSAGRGPPRQSGSIFGSSDPDCDSNCGSNSDRDRQSHRDSNSDRDSALELAPSGTAC